MTPRPLIHQPPRIPVARTSRPGPQLPPPASQSRSPASLRTQPAPNPHPRATAFTLFELLLAVAIFSIVLLAIHTVFYNALSLRNRTTQQLEKSVALEQTLEILQRDLANLVPPGGTFSGPFQSPLLPSARLGPTSVSSSNAFRAALPGRVVSPTFHTTTGIVGEQSPWSEISRVTYCLANPTNDAPGLDLIRSVSRNLLPVFEDQLENQWLLGGVDDLTFLYFDGFQWIDTWDSTIATPTLPTLVKIQLQLAPDPLTRIAPQPVELVVPLLVQSLTNQTVAAASEGGGA